MKYTGRPFWEREGGWQWNSPDPIFVGGDDTKADVDYSNLPGTSESISSDFTPTDGRPANFIPIIIIAFIMYKFL